MRAAACTAQALRCGCNHRGRISSRKCQRNMKWSGGATSVEPRRLGLNSLCQGRFMRWGLWYRIRSYTRSSLWVVPFIAIPLEMIAIRVIDRVAPMIRWQFLDLGTQAARTMLETVVTASLSFLVFTFGSLLVA